MNPVALLGLGFLLGLRHATDPDHVVAVAAITSRTRRLLPAAGLGLMWGLGHTLTLFVVGGAILLLDLVVPPRLGLALELAVAVALVVVGALNLVHPHAPVRERVGSPWRAFGVGLVHGLAGSAAVALLVVAAVGNTLWGALYLLVFGAGTLAGMTLVTTGFAAPLTLASARWPALGHSARLATGVASVAFGLWLIWQIGWVDGLFGSTPRWDAH